MSIPPPPSPPPGWYPQRSNPWGVPGDARPPGSGPPGYQPYGPTVWNAPREHPNGTLVLVLGILSLVGCGLLGPVAWVMGNRAIREMDAEPGVTWTNRGNVTAGRIIGIITSVLVALGLALAVVGLAAVIFSNA